MWGRVYVGTNRPGFWGKAKTKIGKVLRGNSVQRRAQSIERSGQPFKPEFSVWLWDESKTEARLHRRFKNRKAKAVGSGRTEWFNLTWSQRQMVKIELLAISAAQRLLLTLAIGGAILAAMAWLK